MEQKPEKPLDKKAARFHRVLTSPDGAKCFEDLIEAFDHDEIKGDDPYETYYKLGQRDVIVYLKQLIRYDENAARRRELERQSSGGLEGPQQP